MPNAALSGDCIDFIHALQYADIPESARHAGRRLLLDTLGTAAAGSATRASRILRDHAARFHGAGEAGARLLFDGRRVAPQGAALAGAGSIDSIDAHDGHRLTKGHAGVTVLPALLAFCDELAPCSGAEFLTRLVLGYEVATRAGIALHASVADYHTSGAWNALAAAALGARALGLSRPQTAHALGIAEYYGPRSQMMRVIDHPTMLKDGSAMGALAGVSAALLAAEGFTGAPAVTVTGDATAATWRDLGRRWTIEEQYIKAYPVCRWAQPAVEAVLSLRRSHDIASQAGARVTIHSFTEAVRLTTRRPRTTDEAQYSLPFPVAAALLRGRLGVAEIDGPGLADPEVVALSEAMVLVEEPAYCARFPAERWAHAVIDLADGRRLVSEPCPARGDPETPFSDAELEEKFKGLAKPLLGERRCAALVDACRAVDGFADSGAFVDGLLAPLEAPALAAAPSEI
ncbi:MmgE/PrpD family protein [Pelagibius marinus]|uniref:MmgE/PrpD family protein n=1 Tax=Pelagibius marinus TaxID=2762760 RepID=UPI0018722F43|nr:MmgE/PrpD family protein [Pelagibius marinus]